MLPLTSDAVEKADFSRYQAILERQPFGEVTSPENADAAEDEAALPVTTPPETLDNELELRALVDDGDSLLRAGFFNKQTGSNFSLKVGDRNEFYELVSADYENEEVMLKRGADIFLLSMRPKRAEDKDAETASPLPPGTPQGFVPLTPTPGAIAPQGFFPVAPSEVNTNFFTSRRRGGVFGPAGTNIPPPFQSRSLEHFMKTNTNRPPGIPRLSRGLGAERSDKSRKKTMDTPSANHADDTSHGFLPFATQPATDSGEEGAFGFIMKNSGEPLPFPPLPEQFEESEEHDLTE